MTLVWVAVGTFGGGLGGFGGGGGGGSGNKKEKVSNFNNCKIIQDLNSGAMSEEMGRQHLFCHTQSNIKIDAIFSLHFCTHGRSIPSGTFRLCI